MSEQEFDEFFAGGGGAPSFDFEKGAPSKPTPGGMVKGVITKLEKTQQTNFSDGKPLFWDDNKPRMQIEVTLQTEHRNWDKVSKVPTVGKDGPARPTTDDDGTRRIYIKGDMVRACREAFQAAGVTGPRVGGKLAVRVKGFEDVGKGNPKSLYEARYEAPAPQDEMFASPAQQAPAQQPLAQAIPQQQIASPTPPPAPAPTPAPADPWAAAPAPAPVPVGAPAASNPWGTDNPPF